MSQSGSQPLQLQSHPSEASKYEAGQFQDAGGPPPETEEDPPEEMENEIELELEMVPSVNVPCVDEAEPSKGIAPPVNKRRRPPPNSFVTTADPRPLFFARPDE